MSQIFAQHTTSPRKNIYSQSIYKRFRHWHPQFQANKSYALLLRTMAEDLLCMVAALRCSNDEAAAFAKP